MPDFLVYAAITALPLVALALAGTRVRPAPGRARVQPATRTRGVVLWVLAGAVALATELAGEAVGLWSWSSTWLTALHAWWWWASLITVAVLRLSHLGPGRWFALQLTGMLAFEFSQQATIAWVTHPTLFGSRYVAIAAIHVVVCAILVGALPSTTWALGLVRPDV